MIIKRKYTEKPKNDENAQLQNNEEGSAVESDLTQETVSDNIDETSDNISEQADEQSNKNQSFGLDFSIDDIHFEQRPERREGSRRRGYRRTQDRNIVSRAQKDAQTIKEAAKQDGYREGISQAKNDIEALKTNLSEFYGYKDVVFNKVSECILDISVEIAKKIINKQIETDSDAIISIIKAAVSEVNKTEEKLTLKVMPKDVELVKDRIPEIFSDGSIEAKISVVPDNNIKEGGVIIETTNGIIDATIETQLAIVENAIKTQTGDKDE